MNVNMYVINVVLILMVIRQICEHPLDARSLAGPVPAVGAAAVLFLRSVPVGGSDVTSSPLARATASMSPKYST